MNIHEIYNLMDPVEFEEYAAELIAGSPPLGRIGRALHVLDQQHKPALILCKHIVNDSEDVLALNSLMLKYNIKRGYLITPGEFYPNTRQACRAVSGEILLLDGNDLDDLYWERDSCKRT